MLTPYQDRKMKKFASMNVLSWKQRSKKNSRKKKVNFQNNVLVPKTKWEQRGCHRSGYTLPFLSGLVRQAGRQCLHGNLTLQESPIKYHKCPTNETPAIFSHLIDSPKQMKQMNKDADESDKNISD